VPLDKRGQRIRSMTVFITKAEAYAMLSIGNALQSEPFRKWGVDEGNFGGSMYLKLFGPVMVRIHPSTITEV